VSDLDQKRSIHRHVKVVHSSFIEGPHMTKNTASVIMVPPLTVNKQCNPSLIFSGNPGNSGLGIRGSLNTPIDETVVIFFLEQNTLPYLDK
jgi:hypothetical protein